MTDIRTELMLAGSWVDITSDVYQREAVRITRGMRDLGTSADPASLTFTLNNRLGKYSRRNPNSPLFGQLNRNTPVRVSLPAVASYLQGDGAADSVVSAPFVTPAGDLDIRWEGAPGWWRSSSHMLVGQWDALSESRGWVVSLLPGQVVFQYSTDGTRNTTWFHLVDLHAYIPESAAIRVTMDTDNGAGGRTAQFFWADSLDSQNWELMGTVTLDGVVTRFVSGQPLRIGVNDPVYERSPFVGRCTRMQVRQGINGTVIAAPDFRALPEGTTSFTDAVGLNWTISGTAEVRAREDRFVGEISNWPTEWSIDGADIWANVKASGILHRLGQGQKPLASALRRRIPWGKPTAYWPLEDGMTSTQAASAVDGGEPATVSGWEFGQESSLLSSSPLPVHNGNTSASFLGAVRGAGTNGWHVEMVYKVDALPAADRNMLTVRLAPGTGDIREVRARASTAGIRIEALNSNFDVVAQFTNTTGIGDFIGVWNRLQLFSYQSGSQTYVTLAWRNVVTGLWWYVFVPYTGTPGRVVSVRGAWVPEFQGLSIGHIAVFDTGGLSQTSPGVTLYEGSDSAYVGETTWRRMMRLCYEESLPFTYVGGRLFSTPTGPQLPETMLSLLAKAADADGGMLTEDPHRIGLHYRSRASLYNQPPKLTLDYTRPGLAPGFAPVDDDEATVNDVTVEREFGSSARVVAETGPLSVADIGQYDETVTLSLAEDNQILDAAAWRLHLGTFDGARYPALTLMLHKPGAEALVPDVLSLREGDVIRLTNLPAFVSADDVDLMVVGWSEEMDLGRWEVTLVCTPADPWRVAEVASQEPMRADASEGQSALAVAAGDADTELVVQTEGVQWVQANPALNPNPYFESDLTGWAPSGSVLARVPTPAGAPFPDESAMTITPDGVAQYPNAGSDMVPVTPGAAYVVSGYVSCATARNVALNVNWFDAAQAYLSTSANDQAVAAGEWSWFEMTATAPAGAAYANVAPTVPDFPPVTDVMTVTRVSLRRAGGSPYDLPFNLRIAGEVVRADAVRPILADSFSRTTVNGWGTADTGQAWTTVDGTAASFSTDFGVGNHIHNTSGVFLVTHTQPLAVADVDVSATLIVPFTPAGNSVYGFVLARVNEPGTRYYFARLMIRANGTTELSIRRKIPDETLLVATDLALTHVAGRPYRIRLRIDGNTLRAKAWLSDFPEPDGWNLTATDTLLPAPGGVGLRSYITPTVTNPLPLTMSWENLSVTPQVMHVARSRNGVVKELPAGAEVRLANPSYVAF